MAKLSASELVTLIQDRQLDAIVDIENRAVRQATEKRFKEIDSAIKKATRDWTREFGSASADPEAGAALTRMIREATTAVTKSLRGLSGDAERALNRATNEAIEASSAHAATLVEGLSGDKADKPKGVVKPEDNQKDLKALKKTIRDSNRDAKRVLKRPAILRLGLRGLLAGLNTARKALVSTATTVATSVTRTVDKVSTKAAEDADALEVWVPDRDACVRCTRYAGIVVQQGGTFTGGLSWDPKSRKRNAPRVRPPLHPNCRCKLVPWKDSWATPGAVTFPEAVRREAERSIARGFSLPSESNASRVRALNELLKTNPQLPKTVLERARRAARKGEFPKGRSVPNP